MKRVFNIFLAFVLSSSLLSAGTPIMLVAHYCGSELMELGTAEDISSCHESGDLSEYDTVVKCDCCSLEDHLFTGTDYSTLTSKINIDWIALPEYPTFPGFTFTPVTEQYFSHKTIYFPSGGMDWRIIIQSFQI